MIKKISEINQTKNNPNILSQIREPNLTNTSEPLPEYTKQIPASQVQHQMGEQIAYMVIPKTKQKYQVYWGADPKT